MGRKLCRAAWAAPLVLLASAASGQNFKQLDKDVFARLAAKASEHVTVTLDGDMLRLASGFLSGKDADDAKLRNLIAGLKSVTVRSFEFSKPGEYTKTDLDSVRTAIGAEWSRIVDVEDKQDGEHTEVYLLSGKDKAQGVFVISAESTELTVVQVMGPISLADLASLEDLGVPNLSGLAGDVKKKD